jgi:hypothetical protein
MSASRELLSFSLPTFSARHGPIFSPVVITTRLGGGSVAARESLLYGSKWLAFSTMETGV